MTVIRVDKNPIAKQSLNGFLSSCERSEQERRCQGLVELDQFKYTLNTYRGPLKEVGDSL